MRHIYIYRTYDMIHTHIYIYIQCLMAQSSTNLHRHDPGIPVTIMAAATSSWGFGGGAKRTLVIWLRRKQFDQPSCYGKKLEWSKNMIWFGMMIWADRSWSFDVFGRVETIRNDQPVDDDLKVPGHLMNCSMECFFFALPLWSFLSVGTWQLSFWQATNQQQAAEHIPKLCAKQPSISKSCKHFFCLWSVSLRNDREKVLCWELFKQARIRHVMYAYSYMYVHVHICALCTRISVYTCIYWLYIYISYMYSDVYICICTCK